MSSESWEDPTLSPGERRHLVELARRLEHERPAPAPAFRGDLRRRLLSEPRRGSLMAMGYRRLAASYAGAGLLCLVIAGAGLGGLGPFAA